MRRLVVLALVVLIGCPATKEPAAPPPPKGPAEVTEVEPNDSSATAQKLEVPVRTKATWLAGAKPDEDWFRIEPEAPVILRVEASGVEGVASTLTVYDADRNVLVRTKAASGETATVPNVQCEQACFVEVKANAKEATGDYTLSIDTKRPAPKLEREPNGRILQAQPVTLGGQVEGYLHPSDDEDLYLVDTTSLAPEQVLAVRLTPPDGLRLVLGVQRPSDQSPLGEWASVEPGAAIHVRNLTPAAGETGVLLTVKSLWVRNAAGKSVRLSNARESYTLEVAALDGDPSLEREPNDEAARATPIEPGQSRTGHLSPKADHDWYAFELAESAIVHAEVSGVEGVDLELSLIDPQKLGADKDDELARANDGTLGEEEIISNVVAPAGRNWLRVRSVWKKIDDRWVRDFANADRPYVLKLETMPDDGTVEREPNNTSEKASPLQLGQEVRGWIHPAKDVDLWRLELSSPADVAIVVSAVPKLDLSITVRDATRPPGDGAAVVGSVDRLRVEGEERLVVPFEAGSWLIEIREKGTQTNAAKPYVLSVK